MEEKVLYHKKGQHWEFTITRNSVKEIIKGLATELAKRDRDSLIQKDPGREGEYPDLRRNIYI